MFNEHMYYKAITDCYCHDNNNNNKNETFSVHLCESSSNIKIYYIYTHQPIIIYIVI